MIRTFREIFSFELRQQLKSPLFWLIALAFAAIAFGAATSDDIQIGGGIGNTHRNAPYVITQWMTICTLIGMFLIPVFVAGAALRDFEAGTAEMFFVTPMPRSAYLSGRFAAGYLAAAVVMVAVALGLLIGTLMPWVDPARLGPTTLGTYVYAFEVFVLPGLFFMSALLFLLATLTRSMLTTYIGVIAFFVFRLIAKVTAGNLEHHTLGALLDPFGLGALELVTRYWSADDRNTRLPEIAGVLLANRVIWFAISAAMIAATLALFRTDREGLRLWGKKPTAAAAPSIVSTPVPIVLPSISLRTNASARWTQFLKLAWFDTRGVLGGVAFLVMLAFGLMNLGASLAFANQIFGTKAYPVTHLMNEAMDGSYKFLLYFIIAFYAGELVWRERSGRISEVTDAFPLPDWIPLLSKLTAITSVIVLFLLAGCVECTIYQLCRGYHHIEPSLYLSNLTLTALQFMLIAALALFLQVIANNKFLGYLMIVIFFISGIALEALHYDHNLYNYGSAPAAPYSDMNGYGHFLAAYLWFSAYWACLATAALVVAALYWTRGTTQGWKERTRVARARFRVPSRALLASSLASFVVLGGWIFYNTNVINRYVPADVMKEQRADYEKLYRQYKDLPQPKITAVRADVDIYPHERRVDIRGHYVLENKTDKPIGDLHMQLPVDSLKLVSATFAPHEMISENSTLGYTIYRLKQPLAPGASMDFDFVVQYWSRGFRNTPDDTHVVDNGTFFNNSVFPHFGYSEDGQLTDRNDRRKYGLGEAPRMPKINDLAARQFNLMGRDADWVTFETTVSTIPDQIALAPGYLVKEWTTNGRRYFHYKMDKPILDFFSFQSARYAVKHDTWNGVALDVYYDPQHAYNVDRMLYAAKRSMAHYSSVYAAYQFRQFRILEFPDYARFAQSFANTVPFSEAIGFIADLRDPADIDFVYYVTAHELAHQWWGHQVNGAKVQGVTMLDETFAQYSALMVQEQEYGAAKMHKFLKYELDRYLSGRGTEVVEELPLALNENQDYIHYRKGSVVMYSLKDYLGEDIVDRALARYDRETAYQQPPYTTTRDFLADLRQEAGPQWSPLIADLFDKITIFDDRVSEATAKKRPDGKYDVTLKLHAAKIYVDGIGKETPTKLDEPIDIGVFAKAADGKEDDEKVLYLQKRSVADGDSSVTITVDSEPYEAGIDPYNKLIDRVSSDNRMQVSLQ
ncbi:MAG TPA: M1 family aminopeptidase [Xanthomonadaceae bacterium]|nr:M1 family aminopeptidase [Xanthomonadaceae bacterium]